MVGKVSLKEVNRFLLCSVLVVTVLHFGKEVLVPVCFSVFFAMLFTPLSNRMERWGLNRIFTSLISILIIIIASFLIGLMVYAQSKKLADQFPKIEQKTMELKKKVQGYIGQKMNIPEKKQEEVIDKQMKEGSKNSTQALKTFVGGFFGILTSFVMILIFTFLFLLQREKYETFFIRLSSGSTTPDESKKLIGRISTVAQSYLTGRVISILIFTVLFSAGFLIIGLEGAFLLAFLAALLTIVPYLGSIVGGLFPFAVALVTADTNVAIGALIVVGAVQAIDNYFIEPYIIGGEVNISGFFTILILLIGGILWGIAGMVLFLPMLAVAKIIFDSIPELKPYGYLIGDQEGGDKPSEKLLNKLKKIFKKNKPENKHQQDLKSVS